jgi:hypothetical protein
MVAMVLLAVLGVALAQGTRFGMQAWARLDGTLDRSEPIALTQAFLRREIEQAQPISLQPPRPGQTAPQPIAFAGSGGELHFVSTMPERAEAPGLDEMILRLEPGKDGTSLTLSWRTLAAPEIGGAKSLLAGIASGSFLYFGSIDGVQQPEWLEEWSNPRVLPRLVALRLKFRDARLDWPDLLVAPVPVPDSTAPAT